MAHLKEILDPEGFSGRCCSSAVASRRLSGELCSWQCLDFDELRIDLKQPLSHEMSNQHVMLCFHHACEYATTAVHVKATASIITAQPLPDLHSSIVPSRHQLRKTVSCSGAGTQKNK